MPLLELLARYRPRCASFKRRNLCGLLMLMLVDLIWVGSAGLTRVRPKKKIFKIIMSLKNNYYYYAVVVTDVFHFCSVSI